MQPELIATEFDILQKRYGMLCERDTGDFADVPEAKFKLSDVASIGSFTNRLSKLASGTNVDGFSQECLEQTSIRGEMALISLRLNVIGQLDLPDPVYSFQPHEYTTPETFIKSLRSINELS